MASHLRYFKVSLLLSALGVLLGAGIGYYYHGTLSGVLNTVFIIVVLSVLEISLSFDNAVVNATVLKDMTPLWRHRFLTWGIAIAVFGMRLVFPLVVVSVVAKVGPLRALLLAATQPDEYARILSSAHVSLGGFGGAFLGMVCLKYFFDAEKDVHWIHQIESHLKKLGRIEAVEAAVMLLCLYAVSTVVHEVESHSFLVSGIFGLVTFILVDGVSAALEIGEDQMLNAHKASAGLFVYLEVLDASFSFDGVIGAFALTNNLFIIGIGLGIGALFVRSMTVLLVDEGTLTDYRYLEHGAFYAIGALAAILFIGTVREVPEVVTGFVGAAFIGLSFWSSVRTNRAECARPTA